MKNSQTNWLLAAFAVSFFVVGIPYWLIPYSSVSLPSSLLTLGLVVVAAMAILLRAFQILRFWSTVGFMTATLPAVIVARVVLEIVMDPTSHNLWPFEVVIAAALGFMCAIAGAGIGHLVAKLRGCPPGDSA